MKDKKLHNINSTGFKAPENYFDSLEDSILSRLAEERLASKIKSSGFKVANDYFEVLDSKVMHSIEPDNSVKVVTLFSWKKLAYISGIAASIVLAWTLIFNNPERLTFEDLETASIENYLMYENLSAYEIAPYLGASELDADDFIETDMNTSDIEDYLLQNSDIEQLITD